MAGALNMLVRCLSVFPVVRERPFHPKVLERLPGDALLDSWLPAGTGFQWWRAPRLLGLCILCVWDAELLPQKSSALNLWNTGLLR